MMTPRRDKSKSVAKSDVDLLAKIDAIVKEIRELRRSSVLLKRSEEAKLSSIQRRALQVLAEGDEMTSGEVAKALTRSRSSMVVCLNQLTVLGLLEKVRKKRRVYFRRKRLEPSGIVEGLGEGGCYLFVVLASDSWLKNVENVEKLVAERLKDIPNWRIERMTVLPRS